MATEKLWPQINMTHTQMLDDVQMRTQDHEMYRAAAYCQVSAGLARKLPPPDVAPVASVSNSIY